MLPEYIKRKSDAHHTDDHKQKHHKKEHNLSSNLVHNLPPPIALIPPQYLIPDKIFTQLALNPPRPQLPHLPLITPVNPLPYTFLMQETNTPRTLAHSDQGEWERLLLGLQADSTFFGLLLGGAAELGHREMRFYAGLRRGVWESALAVAL